MTDAAIAHAAAAFRTGCGTTAPALGIVLGSGLSGLAAHIEHPTRVRFADLPGLPMPLTPGHTGELVHGMLGPREVVVVAGRLHRYEGVAPDVATVPIRILAALGVRALVLSNAAGGIRPDLAPGTFMLITDHLNVMWGGPRLPAGRFGPVYDAALGDAMRDAASAAHIVLAEGVYAAVLGPSYETPAEIRMLARLGADAVGMSTAPEAELASALGMRVAAVSCITNRASGTSDQPLGHANVLAVTRDAAPRFERLLGKFAAGFQAQ